MSGAHLLAALILAGITLIVIDYLLYIRRHRYRGPERRRNHRPWRF
jgi:hypothetical protein